jgi:multiple sugar transport system ATP-binding protein
VNTRAEISKLHQRLGTTFIYVTHDQTEAMTMATRIAVMDAGVIQQVGTPQELYDQPANVFVAGFIGSPAMNFFTAKVIRDGGHLTLDGGSFRVAVPEERSGELESFVDKKLEFGVRPENIHDPEFVPARVTTAPVDVRVDVTELMGNEVFLHMFAGQTKLLARVDPRTKLRADEDARVVMDLGKVHIFDPETKRTLQSGV